MFPRIAFTKTAVYSDLYQHYQQMEGKHMRQMFAQDAKRFEQFSIRLNGLLFDYSKNRIEMETIGLLCKMADECRLREAITAMFQGEPINETEGRAVLHTALRNKSDKPVMVHGKNVMPDIQDVLERMRVFSRKVRMGEWKGYTGLPITDVVNIGIGGSDLGPVMVCEALKSYASDDLKVHFVSNVDATHLVECLKPLKPETTLFIIASKTFTTQETMTNAHSARQWFLNAARDEAFIAQHFVAVSTAKQEVVKFGMHEQNMFGFWEWVGGRYSLWSAIGLSIMLAVGDQHFDALLEGAYAADQHFYSADFSENIPVIMGLLGIWYGNFFGASTQAVLPYDQYLNRFPAFLQQADMESNGKHVDRNGATVTHTTGAVVWGEPGTNGQHAFYQLIHQGTQMIPCDFIVPAISQNELGSHHSILLSHCLAQSEALMNGKTLEEVSNELGAGGMHPSEIERQAPFRVFEGNIPSNTFLLPEITPFQLGQLIALYEHKIFVQGVMWNIYSFDQWGVELGKKLAAKILPELNDDSIIPNHDASTSALIQEVRQLRRQSGNQ